MCIDGNSAPLSVRYLNAQLTALWQNAVECVKYAEHHGSSTEVHLTSHDYDRHKYQRALAQFHYVGNQRAGGSIQKEDLFFNASFAQPRLDFICNHEASLYLKVEKGHFNKAFTKTQGTGSKFRIDRADNVPIEGLEIAYRMKFTKKEVDGHDARIGNGKGYTINLMILDFENAELVMFRSKLSHEVKEALKFYLGQYMHFLINGGQNCLLNLPDFDDDSYSPVLEYSLTTKAIEDELCNDVLVCGTSVDVINEHLRRTWLNVAVLEHSPADKLSLLLTEIQTNWLGDSESHFHVRFSPPTVKALCSHEVVVYYNVDEIIFYDSAELKTVRDTFSGWRIAFVVNVIEEHIDSDVKILKLDFANAQFCRHLSFFSSTNVDVKTYIQEFIEFMTIDYVDLVVEYEFTVLWRSDLEVVISPDGPTGPGGVFEDDEHVHENDSTREITTTTGTNTTTTTETKTITTVIKETTCYHFDQMVTVSEETVNRVFTTWWLTAKKSTQINVIYRYEVEQFKVTFEQPRIQLLSGGRALIWITIGSGKMMVDGKETIVGGWRIAVECRLKMVEHNQLGVTQGWYSRFKETVFGKSQDTTKTIKHVVLDVDSAKIIRELCVFDGIFEAGAKLAVLRTRAVEQYIVQYMKAFANAGYHIVHSTPIYGADAEFGWTSVDFRVVSRTTVTVTNVTHKHEAPVIVVVGMSHDKPMPMITTIEWHAGLVIRSKRTSYGTAMLASKSFLERAILSRLELVNKMTTIVPRFPKAEEEEWKVYLCTWNEHSHRKNRACNWSLVKGSNALSSSALEYAWHHKDVWTYERTGTLEVHGSYNVECETTNHLHLPTNFRSGGMDITVTGKTSLRIKSVTDAEHWSRSSTSTWSATIHITSEWDGLHVRLAQVVKPEIHSEKVLEQGQQAAIAMNTHDMLREQLPQVVDFSSVISELKATLEGTWRYAVAGLSTYRLYSPVFNIHGDLVVQVRPYDPSARPPPAPVAPAPADGSLGRQSTRANGSTRSSTQVSIGRAEGKKRTSLFNRAKEFVQDVVRSDDHKANGDGHKHHHHHQSSAMTEKPSVSRSASTASTSSVSSTSSATSTTSAHSVRTVTGMSSTETVTVSTPTTAVTAGSMIAPASGNGHANGHANGSANGSAKAPTTPKAQQATGLNAPAPTLRPL